jgi:hypothetical protein
MAGITIMRAEYASRARAVGRGVFLALAALGVHIRGLTRSAADSPFVQLGTYYFVYSNCGIALVEPGTGRILSCDSNTTFLPTLTAGYAWSWTHLEVEIGAGVMIPIRTSELCNSD